MQQPRSLIGWVDPRLEGLQRPANPGRTPGLARAISHSTGLDVTLVRAFFVLLTLSTGIGVMLYAWGTLLSYGAGGRRPIDSLLPAFGQWPVRTQATIAAVTAIAFALTFGQWAPLSFVVAVVIVILLYASLSRARRSPMPPPTQPRPTTADPLAAAEQARTVGEWRAAMQRAAHRPTGGQAPADLPEVDLYGAQPEPDPGPPAQKPRSSWGAAALIVLGGVLAFAVVFRADPWAELSLMLGIAAAVMGGLTLLSALVLRGRRIPRLALGVVAAAALASVALPALNPPYIPQEATAEATTAVEEEGPEVKVIEFGNGVASELDLSGEDFGDGVPRRYEINMSNAPLTLKLPPGPIEELINEGEWIHTQPDYYDGDLHPVSITIYGENVDLTVLGGRPVETVNLGSGVTTTFDLTTYDLSAYSAENPLHLRITAADSTVTLRVPEGKAAVSLNGEQLLGEQGTLPLDVRVTGDNVELTLEEI